MDLGPSKIFDFVRNAYGAINRCRFMEKRNKVLLPLRYFFELTHLCNLNCPYCYVGADRAKEELSTHDWYKIIDQIPRYSFITLVGGEPLIRNDFCEILDECSKRTFGKVNVVTNGVLIDDRIIDSFIDSNMLLLSVSLDGWGENHDKYRNKQGIFNTIIDNLDNLSYQCRERGSRLMIDIKTIVLKDNLEDILKLYQYCTNKGFDYLSISFLRNNNLKQNARLYDSFEEVFYKSEYPIEPYFNMDEFEKVYREINKMKRFSRTKIRFSPKFDNEDSDVELNLIKKFFSEYKDKNVNEIYKPCLYPYSNTIINPMGDIYPCLSYKMGNIKEQSLKEIINSTKYCCFRKNLKYSNVFNSCQMCCELKVKDI